MKSPIGDWPAAMANRIGASGPITFTPGRIHQTLHVPCEMDGGHIVDVKVNPHQHPDAVAKKMLQKGWTFGSKLKCPEHSRKPKSPGRVEAGRNRWAGIPPEERSRIQRDLALANLARKKQQQETPMSTPVQATALESSPISAAIPAMSDNAKKAHRLIMQALEDYYDETKRTYRPGYTDKKIADETGSSEANVAKVREEFFGPLGEPDEITAIKADLAKAIEETRKIRQRLVDHESTTSDIKAKLARVCNRNGWPVE